MLVALLIGVSVVVAGQLVRSALASAAKALLEASDMDATLEYQANNSSSSPAFVSSRRSRDLPGNLWHLSRRSVPHKNGGLAQRGRWINRLVPSVPRR
jgi:hypothetical protein